MILEDIRRLTDEARLRLLSSTATIFVCLPDRDAADLFEAIHTSPLGAFLMHTCEPPDATRLSLFDGHMTYLLSVDPRTHILRGSDSGIRLATLGYLDPRSRLPVPAASTEPMGTLIWL